MQPELKEDRLSNLQYISGSDGAHGHISRRMTVSATYN